MFRISQSSLLLRFHFLLLSSFYVQFGNVLKAKVFFLLPLIAVVVSFALFVVGVVAVI